MLKKFLISLILFLLRKEKNEMAVIYVALIEKGIRKFSSVPTTVKEKVRELLIALELEFLIDE